MTKVTVPATPPAVEGSGPHMGYVRNAGGVFLRTPHPTEPGTYFEARVDGPNGELPKGVKEQVVNE